MEKAKRYSKKREAILEAIRATKEHPSADWVYNRLKPQYQDLSLGTVYRNIAQFKDEGSLICVGVVNGQERYDADTGPHTHFICESCGCVIDLDIAAGDRKLDRQVERRCGVRVSHHETVFYGTCQSCCAQGGGN